MNHLKAAILFFCLIYSQLSFSQDQPSRSISNITGDLYRFQNNNHYSVFLVTDEGIIVTDPISKEAAAWLNDQLKKRFNKPVKYLVYSHDHADHISGGEVFGDEVIVVGHELTKEKIISEKRPAPIPDVTFSSRMTIELGGKKLELIYPGKSHSDNCIAMFFPAEKTVFVVDFITVNRLPYRGLNNSYMPDWIKAIETVESLDFDILAPGHGEIGTKEDAADHRQYLQDLQSAVANAIKEGKSLDQMKQSIKLDKYKHFTQYEAWLPLNIEGMYKMLSNK